MDAFVEISLIILLATGISFIARAFKQPLVIAYILTGVLISPFGLNLQQSKSSNELLAKVGIAILLFIVGLNLKPKTVKEIGQVSLRVGIAQIGLTAALGFLLAILLGFTTVTAVYLALALTFSSTIIALKQIVDKKDTETVYGRIAVGILLIQDLVASLLLIIVASLGNSTEVNTIVLLVTLIVKGTLLAFALYLITTKLLPRLMVYITSNQELLFLFSISWGLTLAAVFFILGFSLEIGALVAGVTLSSTIYAPEIASRLKPIRDFFVLLFFVLLGSKFDLASLPALLMPAIVMTLFVLIVKPLIVMVMVNQFGYKQKTGYLSGVTLGQVSEFSLILVGLGVSFYHVPNNILTLITLVSILSIVGSSAVFTQATKLYIKLKNIFQLIEMKQNYRTHQFGPEKQYEAILFGYHRVGADFVKAIQKLEIEFIVVDYDPSAIKRLKNEGLPCVYGDADDPELLEYIKFNQAKLIVSTIPDFETNKLLVEQLYGHNPNAISLTVSHNVAEAEELYELGASYVVMPVYLGAQYATQMIGKYGLSIKGFARERKKHLEHLEKRKV